MSKERINNLLALSSGHPYFRLHMDEVIWLVTRLEQDCEITQKEALQARNTLEAKQFEALPLGSISSEILSVLNKTRPTFSLRDYKLSQIREVRELCDRFVWYYKQIDVRDFEVCSKARYDYLLQKCREVVDAMTSGSDYWLMYQHVDYLVNFCIQNDTVDVADPLFAPIRQFLTTLYTHAEKSSLEMEKENLGFSVNFSETPELKLISDQFELKRQMLCNPAEVLSKRIYSPELFRLIPSLKGNPRELREQILSVYAYYMRTPEEDRSTLLIYTASMLGNACNLCREIHAMLNNDRIYAELYLVEKDFYLNRRSLFNLTAMEDLAYREKLLEILSILHNSKIIDSDVYFEEVHELDG